MDRAGHGRPWVRRVICVSLSLSSVALLAGCGTLPEGRAWGEDATAVPGWKRLRHAAAEAAVAPETWAPAAGALLLWATGADADLTEWAADETPIFGSRDRAARASDRLWQATTAAYALTALGTPSGEEPGDWALNKLKGLAVGTGAIVLNHQITVNSKLATRRMRPDGSTNDAFPSGHSSGAAVVATLASRNVDVMSLPGAARSTLGFALRILAAGAGWARVEARRHYVSDVLAGAALGHFIGALVNDAFLGVDRPGVLDLAVEPSPEGGAVFVRWVF